MLLQLKSNTYNEEKNYAQYSQYQYPIIYKQEVPAKILYRVILKLTGKSFRLRVPYIVFWGNHNNIPTSLDTCTHAQVVIGRSNIDKTLKKIFLHFAKTMSRWLNTMLFGAWVSNEHQDSTLLRGTHFDMRYLLTNGADQLWFNYALLYGC